MDGITQVAFVTGGARGIGWACAKALLETGMAVATMDIIPLEKPLAILEIRGDIGKPRVVERAILMVLENYGRLDFAVNNAAILGPKSRISDIDTKSWMHIIQTNLTGTLLCLKHEISALLKTGGGRIVNISSTCSQDKVGVDMMLYSGYVVSKTALNKLAEVAAQQYQFDGLYINTILATGYNTELHKQLRGAMTGKDPSQMGKLIAAMRKFNETGITDDEEGWIKRIWE